MRIRPIYRLVPASIMAVALTTTLAACSGDDSASSDQAAQQTTAVADPFGDNSDEDATDPFASSSDEDKDDKKDSDSSTDSDKETGADAGEKDTADDRPRPTLAGGATAGDDSKDDDADSSDSGADAGDPDRPRPTLASGNSGGNSGSTSGTTNNGYIKVSGTVRLVTYGEYVTQYSQMGRTPNGEPLSETMYIFVFDSPQQITARAVGDGGRMDTREENLASLRSWPAAPQYIDQHVTLTLNPQEIWWPSDTSMPTGKVGFGLGVMNVETS